MEKMQKGGGGARAKKIPGMGTYRKKSPSKPKGMGMGPGKKPKSKLFGLKGENPFGKKKFQYGGGNPADMKQYQDYQAKAKGMGMMDPQDQRFYARQQMRNRPAPAPAPSPTPGKMQKGGVTDKVKKAAETAVGSPQKMSKTIKKLGSKAKKAMKKIMPAIDKRMGETTQIQRLKKINTNKYK